MYGLVNKAIEEMVCDRFDEDTWETIKEKAEVDIDLFASMEAYPDDITHRLVIAASEVLGLSTEEILHAFGEYWVLYTAKEGYGEMLEMGGKDLPEFLQNLDTLHARVGVNFPKLRPPSFQCSHLQKNSLRLHYYSHREGLAPMVKGLVCGLGKRFDTEVAIDHDVAKGEGCDRDEFSIDFKARNPSDNVS